MVNPMSPRSVLGCGLVVLLSAANVGAAGSDLADAAMRQNRDAGRQLLRQKVDVNAPQPDGTTALHWAVRLDDLDTTDLLIGAGANVSAANREAAKPTHTPRCNSES